MKLPFPQLSFGKKKVKKSYFLCLLLRDEQIAAYILEEINGLLRLVSKQEEILTTPLEQQTANEWLEIVDRVISKAEEVLPKDIMTHKTMFGVKEGWVEDKKIKKDYLLKLKEVCDSLDLQPIGFLVISEAIAHQLQEQEGAPLTAILVEIGNLQVTISHLRAGKIIETKHTIIVESPAKTVDALLKHFTSVTVLPPRIILYDGRNTEQIAQEFITHQWSKTLPFLHMPQIAPLPYGFDAQSVIFGAAEQMGLQVDKSLDLSAPSSPITETKNEVSSIENIVTPPVNQTLAHQFEKEYTENEIASEEESVSLVQTVPADNLGFVEEQDIADSAFKEKAIPLTSEVIGDEEPVLPNDQPFSLHNQPSLTKTKQHIVSLAFVQALPKKITPFITSFFSKKSGIQMKGQAIPRWLYILPIILLIICVSIGWYIFSVKATVKVTLHTKVVEEKGSVTFSTSSDNNFSNNTIAAKDISVTIDGKASTDATGKKNVGTPAKGNLTLYNNSSSPIQLSSGTVVTSSNNVSFTLDKDVTIASASGDVFSGTKPGTTDTPITAKDIGTSYNLPSATTFTVSNNSNIAGKNSSALSGGTQKQVTVVSQADLDKVTKDIVTSVQAKANEAFTTKISSNDVLLPTVTSTEFSTKTYSQKVNDPATSVTLTATMTLHQIAYKKDDLQNLGKFLLKDKFTDNQALSDKGVSYAVTDEKAIDAKTIQASIDLKAGLLPKIDTTKLVNDITGKSVNDAKSVIAQEPQVDTSEIVLHPNIPLIQQVLPRFSKNIVIQVQSND